MKQRFRIAALTLASLGSLFCASRSVQAQIATTGPAALARQMPAIYGPYLANISRVRILEKRGKLGSPYKVSPTRPAGKTAPPSAGSIPISTTFESQEPPFVPQLLAARLGKTAPERQYIEGVLTKCLNFYLETARQKNVPLNDVALALNYYISTNYFVYTRGSGPSAPQQSATRDIIRANMLQDETFRNMSARQKQEAYETLIVLAGFVDLGYGTSTRSGDTKAAEQFRDMAKHNLETLLGQPIANIRFTDDGLVVR
jgi:hypothetical protein